MYVLYIFRREDGVGGSEFGLFTLLRKSNYCCCNMLKHIGGNVRYLVTWNVKVFTVGYSTEYLV
jgi:hypothetical protein